MMTTSGHAAAIGGGGERVKARWSTAAGLHYIQVDPDNDSPDLPLIICLHGRGADANDLASLAFEVHPEGYRWLLPQGPLPVPLGPRATGWAWYSLGEERPSAVVAARERVMEFIKETTTALSVPVNRMALMGFSQGAATSLHVALTGGQTFAAVVAMSGYLRAAETLDVKAGAVTPQKILMVHGTQDQTLDISLAREARALLDQAGLAPRYAEFPMGHTITAESLNTVREFLTETLPPRPASAEAAPGT
jgi:phospholipase/carboxylesterase